MGMTYSVIVQCTDCAVFPGLGLVGGAGSLLYTPVLATPNLAVRMQSGTPHFTRHHVYHVFPSDKTNKARARVRVRTLFRSSILQFTRCVPHFTHAQQITHLGIKFFNHVVTHPHELHSNESVTTLFKTLDYFANNTPMNGVWFYHNE